MESYSSIKGYKVGNINKKTKEELLSLLERQNNIISNKKLLISLPDKGSKIKKFKEEIEKALILLENQDQLSTIFQKMQLNNRLNDITQVLDSTADDHILENGQREITTSSIASTIDDSVDDSSVESLNLRTKSPNSDSINADELKAKSNPKQRHFLPNRNARPFTSSHPKCDKKWIETAVTPPPSHFTCTKPLSISESIELIQLDQRRRQELDRVQAIESLCARAGLYQPDEPSTSTEAFQTYRDLDHSEGTDDEN